MQPPPSYRARSVMPEEHAGACDLFRVLHAAAIGHPDRPAVERLLQARRGMVRLSIAVHAASPRAAQDLLDALHYIVLSTRLEPGCLSCSALSGPEGVSYVEEWGTEADMRRRVRSDAFTPLLSIIETGADSEVHFDFVTRTRGLDYVAEMRKDVVG